MINAKTAREATNRAIAESKDAWLQVEKAIVEAMSKGKSYINFETKPGLEFVEHRKDVKAKLEAEGFTVSYQKYDRNDYEFGNVYTISW